MNIKDLFFRDIERNINPAVVVDKLDEATINTEIEEYVFTNSTINNLYKFLDGLFNSKTDKTGIWVSGFYGSGKSHFIKYVFYCLNKKYSEMAFNRYLDAVKHNNDSDDLGDCTASNITLLNNKIKKTEIDTIIFNIDSVGGQDTNKHKITKIIFNQFNKFRGYNATNIPFALMVEKHLDKINKLDEFIKLINERLNIDWSEKATTAIWLKLKSVLEIVEELDPSVDIASLSNKIKNPDDITIADHLIPELVDFLNTKPRDYRLVFLIDEISQYIGSDSSLLLNLQTIVEEIGAKCGGKIWITTTAQQTLNDFLNNNQNRNEDFGKILGRFETRISLESQDSTYITQKRILDKNSNGMAYLSDYYNKYKMDIENQFILKHDIYSGFDSKDSFINSYPLIPYQFKLIADVFESFAFLGYVIKEVKDNERSLLRIIHHTVKLMKDKEVGEFVTFNSFFNDLMISNLTHIAQRILDRAKSISTIKNDPFAKSVIHTLFMISNISDSKKKSFPATLDNLILLLINTPAINRLDLQKKIESILNILIENTIIFKENDYYQFYKEEEIDVARQIENTVVTSEDRLDYFYRDLLQSVISINSRYPYGKSVFTVSLSIDEKNILQNGDIKIIISVFDTASPQEKLIGSNRNDLIFCINDWFMKDKKMRNDFEIYIKTKKFILLNADSSTESRKIAIDKFALLNNQRIKDIQNAFRNNFFKTPFISTGKIGSLADFTVQSPESRYKNAIEYHLSEVYNKISIADSYAISQDMLKTNSSIDITDKTLSTAENLVESMLLRQGDSICLADVIKQYEKPPYGWRDWAILDILIRLVKKNKRKFEYRSDQIDLKTFIDKASRTNERQAINVIKQENFDISVITGAIDNFKNIFNESIPLNEDFNIVIHQIKEKCKHYLQKYESLKENYISYPFAKIFSDVSEKLRNIIAMRDPKAFFDHLQAEQNTLKTLLDSCKENESFIDTHFKRYEDIKKTFEKLSVNLNNLDENSRKKAEQIENYFNNEVNPGENFHLIMKMNTEITNVIKEKTKEIKQETLEVYNKIFEDVKKTVVENGMTLNEELQKYDLSDEIETEQSIDRIELYKANANNFKLEAVKYVIDKKLKVENKDKETEVIRNLNCVIKDKEDLEDFLAKLKNQIETKLNNNKIVIIN